MQKNKEVRKEQKTQNVELIEDIRMTLPKYKNRVPELDSDSNYYGSYNSEDETDGDVAYVEPFAFKRDKRVKEVFHINTFAKDIK